MQFERYMETLLTWEAFFILFMQKAAPLKDTALT